MNISDIIKGKQSISFEVFPPKKTDSFSTVCDSIKQMCQEKPDFISVTYGAGGSGNSEKTVAIAKSIKDNGVEALAHLTACGFTEDKVEKILDEMKQSEIDNILALRGDLPESTEEIKSDFSYAKDLISFIKSVGGFNIGAACYPEGHITCDSEKLNDQHLIEKQEAGADFLISQLFFDTDKFLSFRDRVVKKGIEIPILAGIMPIMSTSQVQRMIFSCGVSLPSEIIRILYKYEGDKESLLKAGVEHACAQTQKLLKAGVDGVHIYSMNKPEIAKKCKEAYAKSICIKQN